MFLSDKTMKLLLELNAPADEKVALLASMRADEEAARPVQSSAAKRQAKYRANKASAPITDHNAVTVGDDIVTLADASDAPASRPHVEDTYSSSLRSEEIAAADANASEPAVPVDDWPKVKAADLSKALIAEVGSPWLDPSKSLDLNTTLGRLATWKRLGASWEFDVVPTVAKLCQRNRKPVKSWKFFDDAIAQSVADNRAALALPEARGHRATGPPSIADKIADERRQAETLAFQMLDAQDGRTN